MTEPHPWHAAMPGSSILRRLDMLSSFQERDALTERKRKIDIVVISDTLVYYIVGNHDEGL